LRCCSCSLSFCRSASSFSCFFSLLSCSANSCLADFCWSAGFGWSAGCGCGFDFNLMA
jgi:hypothetical protein